MVVNTLIFLHQGTEYNSTYIAINSWLELNVDVGTVVTPSRFYPKHVFQYTSACSPGSNETDNNLIGVVRVEISLEGFSNFLLIVIAPFLLISQLMILGSREAIRRNNLEGIVRLYTWAFVYPFTYICIIFSIYVTKSNYWNNPN
ncbi:hypothetical protein A0127_05500 [Thermococcus peptonophilus]|uniref:Uncharacterized protein n=1 Tax=Thermococcus peptonophilus TaxID=53952 RepID=A0A142CV59_9EURY|nr:hypothetical protein A0127_05500 [Thermococcus peptonophilus]